MVNKTLSLDAQYATPEQSALGLVNGPEALQWKLMSQWGTGWAKQGNLTWINLWVDSLQDAVRATALMQQIATLPMSWIDTRSESSKVKFPIRVGSLLEDKRTRLPNGMSGHMVHMALLLRRIYRIIAGSQIQEGLNGYILELLMAHQTTSATHSQEPTEDHLFYHLLSGIGPQEDYHVGTWDSWYVLTSGNGVWLERLSEQVKQQNWSAIAHLLGQSGFFNFPSGSGVFGHQMHQAVRANMDPRIPNELHRCISLMRERIAQMDCEHKSESNEPSMLTAPNSVVVCVSDPLDPVSVALMHWISKEFAWINSQKSQYLETLQTSSKSAKIRSNKDQDKGCWKILGNPWGIKEGPGRLAALLNDTQSMGWAFMDGTKEQEALIKKWRLAANQHYELSAEGIQLQKGKNKLLLGWGELSSLSK